MLNENTSSQNPESCPTPASLTLPDGVPPLSTLYLYIAGSCNLACRHCWITPTFRPDGSNGKYISLDHVRKAVDEGKSVGLCGIKLTGGEPTLHPQFRELVDIIYTEGLSITMETNGTLIDSSLAKFIATHGFRHISISLDGAIPETHDYLRVVQGSYDAAVNGIRELVNVGIRPQMICTLHRDNYQELDAVVALAEEIGCSSVKFNLLQRMGRGDRFVNDKGLEISEMIDLYKHVEQDLLPDVSIPIYYDIPMAFRSIGHMLHGHLGRCAVENILGILSNGDLSLCGVGVNIPELIYGNIGTDNLAEVWINGQGLQELRELVPMQLEGICSECIHKNLCKGSCVAHNYNATRKINGAYRFCSEADAQGLFPESRKRPVMTPAL